MPLERKVSLKDETYFDVTTIFPVALCRYEVLSNTEKSKHLDDDQGEYYTRLYNMCQQLSTLLQHDEL